MKTRGKLLAATAALAVSGIVGSTQVLAADATEHITVYVLRGELSPRGPDGRRHDMFTQTNFVLRQGNPVKLTIINYDEGMHSITSEKMGLNILVKAGQENKDGTITPVTTVYRFTPAKAGTFRWHCTVPCDRGGNY